MMVPEQMHKHAKSLGASRYVGITHEVNTMPMRMPVAVSISKAQQFIWGQDMSYTGEQMSKLLSNLGFVVSIHEDTMTCMPPIWRSPVDITHVQDIYEEIARIV
jgi:phenylalanyl-tRNA synthetase beta subunit